MPDAALFLEEVWLSFIDLLNPEKIVAGSVYARSHHLLDKTMYEELEKKRSP